MTNSLGPANYQGNEPQTIEFKRFDDYILWLWGEEALDPSIDFLEVPTGAPIGAEFKLKSLKGIEKFTHLKALHLGHAQLPNLKGIEALESLHTLTIHGNNIRKLDPLSELKQLNALHLALVSLSDLSPLMALKQLQWLTISQCGLKDLSPLAECTNLGVLRLHYCEKLRDLSPLAQLPLRHLDLELSGVRDADFSQGFEQLRYLRPTEYKKINQAAEAQLSDKIIASTENRTHTLAEVIRLQAWVKPGEEQELTACPLDLPLGQNISQQGDIEAFGQLRQLSFPHPGEDCALDLSGLRQLARLEAPFLKQLKVGSSLRFALFDAGLGPNQLWRAYSRHPENYRPENYPQLKWWISRDAMWKLAR